MKQVRAFGCLISAAAASAFAGNDFQLGGSTAFSMGGAGIALTRNAANNYRLNPAMLSYAPKKLQIANPSVGFRLDGIGLKDLTDNFKNVKSGVIDTANLLKFGQDFGKRQLQLGLDGTLGLTVSGFAVQVEGQANATTIPNATLQGYTPNANVAPPAGSQLDAYGLGYYSVNLSYGAFADKKQDLSFGATGRIVKGYYTHQLAQYTGNLNTSVVGKGAEMGGQDVLSQSGFGLDLGALYAVSAVKGLHLAATVENAIQPNVKFNAQTPSSLTIQPNGANTFKTKFNIGAGYEGIKGLTLAADIHDLGNKAGDSYLGLGAEYLLSKGFGISAGYNSRTSLTVGFSVGGFNLAYGGKRPLTLGTLLRL